MSLDSYLLEGVRVHRELLSEWVLWLSSVSNGALSERRDLVAEVLVLLVPSTSPAIEVNLNPGV